jgi:hypothetical protein
MAPGTRQMVGTPSLSRLLDTLPQPLGELIFSNFASCQILKQNHEFGVRGVQESAIVHDERFANDQRCALVSIHEWMIPRQSESIARRKRREVGLSVSGKILWARKRAIEQAFVPKAGSAAVNRELLVVHCNGERPVDPAPVHLFCEFAKCPEAPLHHASRDLHLAIKVLSPGLDLQAPGGGGDCDFIALHETARCKHVARNNDPC